MIWLGKEKPKHKTFEKIDWNAWITKLSEANYDIRIDYSSATTSSTSITVANTIGISHNECPF